MEKVLWVMYTLTGIEWFYKQTEQAANNKKIDELLAEAKKILDEIDDYLYEPYDTDLEKEL
jgi:hypothetical protein